MNRYIIILLLGCFLVTYNSKGQSIKLNSENIYVNVKGKPYSGVYKEYYENGNLKLQMKLKKGFKNGNVFLYFENGKLSEVYSYKNNMMDGLWISYNQTGVKTAEARYIQDKKHGEWKVWDENGTLIYLMYYNNGEKSGTWIKYNEKGEEIARKTY